MTPSPSGSPLDFQDEIRIVLIVTEYVKTRAFYERTLGLVLLDEWDRGAEDKGAVYALGGTRLEILKGDRALVSRGIYAYVEIKDVDALWDRLHKQVKVVDPIETRPWGHRNFSIRDPNGFMIKFFSER